MLKGAQLEQQCTYQCRSEWHGDTITAAISKRGVSDNDLCCFLNYTCCRCESVTDPFGRTAVHVAASCGRVDLVRWLVRNRHADIEVKDKESGYTALHRSLFYGKIHVAVELIKLGASVSNLDYDGLTALEHLTQDGLKPDHSIISGELYCWGSNNNNLLGLQQARHIPELLDIFHKKYPRESVQQVCIDRFHTVIVSCSGRCFACGHGQGGRLGLGDEKTVITPQVVQFPTSLKNEHIMCLQAAISRDHSVFLCSDGNIYTCGLNTYKVLGQLPPPECCFTPRQIKHSTKEFRGVCAGQYHTVAWSSDVLYTWGLNAGQLGHKIKDHFIMTPKAVNITNHFKIVAVAASTGATVVCTKKGDIYVLHEFLCRKIASRQLNIVQVTIVGGKLDSSLLDQEMLKESKRELKVGVLTNTGNILLWQDSDQQLRRCIYSINRAIVFKQIHLNLNEMLMVSDYGEGFKGIIKPRKQRGEEKIQKNTEKSAFHKFLEKEECVMIVLEKIPRIHRGLYIQSDLKGKDYCVIQRHPYREYQVPDITPTEISSDFHNQLNEVDRSDNIHDVVFKVSNQYFPAHKYLISNQSSYLANLISDQELVPLPGVEPTIFREFLCFVYTGECELTRCGELKNENLRDLCPEKKLEDDITAYEFYSQKNKNNQKNPVRMLHEFAKRFECVELQKILGNLYMDHSVVKRKGGVKMVANPLVFDRAAFPNLYDVTVKCTDNKELKAHRCVLSARLEYFNSMFTRWSSNQTTEVNLPFPKGTAEALLEFLYTDSLSNLEHSDIEHLFRVLILADQLFVIRLKEQCELLLSDLLTLKNAVQVTVFAHVYNAIKLKLCCMKFIVSNVTVFLESRSLEALEDDILAELSELYFQEKKEVWCRVITPYSTAESDEDVLSIASAYPVSFEEKMVIPNKPVHKRRSRPHRSNNSEKTNSISLENDAVIQFPDVPEEPKPEPARLKSIIAARDIVKSEDIDSHYVKLAFDFPELSSPPMHSTGGFCKSPPQNSHNRHKIVRLSQKQRKRLSSESSGNAETPTTQGPPKNPWRTLPEPSSPVASLESECTINEIISAEKKQKENLVKIKSKSLIYTQIEDKAMEELRKFYNTELVDDEIITIERVSIGAIASPTWVLHTK